MRIRSVASCLLTAALVGLLLLAAPLSTPSAPLSSTMDFVLTAADNGTTLSFHRGNTGELRLPETPTTGYRWSVDTAPAILSIQETDFTPPHSTTMGGGGERRWVIQAKTAGTATLTLKRWREWEGDPSVVERYQVTVQVTP